MRELKFRFWNKDDKVLWENEEIPMIIIEKDKINPLFDTGAEYRDIGENIVTMQYVGKKDIEGKEIYEGDIVNVFNNLLENEPDFKGVIKYYNYSFVIDRPNYYYHRIDDMMLSLKVIGNIYENPELIG